MRKVAIRGLVARKTRLVLTSLAVALGVTLIAGTYVFTDTINSSFDKIFTAAYKDTDVVVTPSTPIAADDSGGSEPAIPDRLVAQIRKLPGVAQVDGSIFDQNAAILDKDGKPTSKGAPNFIASIHDVKKFETLSIAEGRQPASADEVAIDKATADRHGFNVGGTVDIVDKQPRKTYKVVGLVKLAGTDSYGGASVALMTLGEAQRMSGKTGGFDQIDVAGTASTSPDALRAVVRRALPASRFDVRTGSQEAASQTSDIKDNLSFLTTALLAFAGISLFVGAFIIFNTFSITVAQRAREFALLRTLGASRAQVLRSVLTEGLVLGALGSLAGLALGVLVAKGLKALFHTVGFDVPQQGTVLETRTIVVSLLVGVVVTIVASLAPALRATRVPPVAALQEGVALPTTRSSRFVAPLGALLALVGVGLMILGLVATSDSTTGLSLTGAGAAATFIGVALLSPKLVPPIAAVVGRPFGGITGRLARENSVRQPGRTAATAAALMIGVTLVSFASIFAASAKTSVSGYIDRGMAGQAVVQNRDSFSPFSAGAASAVAKVDGVRTVSALRFAQVRLSGSKKDRGVTGVDPQSFGSVYNLTRGEGVIDSLGNDTIAVEKDFAKKQHLETGQTITLQTATTRALKLRVAGIFEDKASLLGDLVVTNAVVQRDVGVDRDSYLFVGYDDGADASRVKAAIGTALKADYPQTEALSKSEFKADQAGQIDQVLGLIYALLALAIVVSLFGIVNTLVLSITERTRELGMLRAIGTSRRQLKKMIRREAVITAVIGGVLGLVLGVVLSILFTQAIDGITLAVPVVSLVIVLILSAVAGVLAAALPARRAARLDVLKALAHE